MAKSKKTEKDFAFPLLAAMKHSMSGDEKGKTKVGAQKGKVSQIETQLKLKSFRVRLVRHDSFRKKSFGSVCTLGRLLTS
jgi:hypothetical protein